VWFQNRRAKWKKRKKTTNVFRSSSTIGVGTNQHNLTGSPFIGHGGGGGLSSSSPSDHHQQHHGTHHHHQSSLFADPSGPSRWTATTGGHASIHGTHPQLVSGFSPSLSQLNQLSNALNQHHHQQQQQQQQQQQSHFHGANGTSSAAAAVVAAQALGVYQVPSSSSTTAVTTATTTTPSSRKFRLNTFTLNKCKKMNQSIRSFSSSNQ